MKQVIIVPLQISVNVTPNVQSLEMRTYWVLVECTKYISRLEQYLCSSCFIFQMNFLQVLHGITLPEMDILDNFEDVEYERRTVDVALTVSIK